MKPADKIKELIKNLRYKPSAEAHNRMLSSILKALDETKSTHSARPSVWRIIMKSKITKLIAAAVIIIAVSFGLKLIGGPDMANTAWAEVTNRVNQVDYAHIYYLKCRDNNLKSHFEAWYSNGKMVIRGSKGGMSYDDGQSLQSFDNLNRRIAKEPSYFAKGQTFWQVFTLGFLSDENDQMNQSQQVPSSVGSDFLIYELEPPVDESDYIDSVYVTVGKNSLLPIQVKIYHKDGEYDFMIFDYEVPEKPSEFFEPPVVSLPSGRAEVVLDGEEVSIDIADTPGLKTAIVRLHEISPDTDDEPVLALDVTFITEEGFSSSTNSDIQLKVGEAKNCGVGSKKGGPNNWPDGKYRNIRFSPSIKPADREDTYIVEINCFILTN